jgi:hypothetical protein
VARRGAVDAIVARSGTFAAMALPRVRFLALLLAAACTVVAGRVQAAPPEPSGPHPRLWLDASTRASMKVLAKSEGNAIARSVRECRRLGGVLKEEAKNLYMGLDWAAHASNCAVAYQATGDASHAATALHFFRALLDDWEYVGDGKGGDTAARHDSGYAIRALGVHTAIVYDLLHDAPGMTPALLAKARTRFKAWTDWYWGNGYRYRGAGTNYHAGYAFAVTLMAIAQGSEAGPSGAKMWRHVTDEVWGRDMKAAAAPGGLLEGGDWGEGWQYAPLAVASYALAARAMIAYGLPLPEFERWAEQVVLRQIHALAPGEKGSFVGGDTQAETASLPPNPWTLAGALAGPTARPAAGWARAEIDRLHLAGDDKSFLIFEALADARNVEAVPFPRDTAPTFYLAKGNGAMFARSSWSPAASWMAMQCTRTLDVDHLPSNAGNLVLTRGSDELVVDPSPYGSLSSLTSNAPTVESGHLPADYKPSQAFWSERTGYAWARQTASAIVAARCDYADQYRFQERPSDVPMATRDVVLVPSDHGNATAVVVDRARTGAASRPLHLRFRTTAGLTQGSGVVRGAVGGSALTITSLFRSSGTPGVRKTAKGDCFGKDTTRGNCTAARFNVEDYVLTVKGDEASAIHVLDVAAATDKLPAPRLVSAPDHRVVSFERGKRRASVVISAAGDRPKLTYRAAPGHHVVLDAPGSGTGRAAVTAVLDGALCVVTVTSAVSGGVDARPVAVTLSDACAVKEDVTQLRPALAAIDGVAPSSPAVATHAAAAGINASGASSSSSLPPELFGPAPDAVQLPPGKPPTEARRGACGCVSAGARSSSYGGALALVGLALLGARRLNSSSARAPFRPVRRRARSALRR